MLFSQAPRQLHVVSPGPGPGSYTPILELDASKRKSPAFSIGLPHAQPIPTTPAPNAYFPEGSSRSPAFSFGTRVRGPRDPTSPGPAGYTVPAPRTVAAPIIFGKPKPPPVSAGPGPGKYSSDVNASKSSGFTFGARPAEKVDAIPGTLSHPL